ncbi:hypothetical protein ACUM6F_03305 [Desulforudis sp. DRI-14]
MGVDAVLVFRKEETMATGKDLRLRSEKQSGQKSRGAFGCHPRCSKRSIRIAAGETLSAFYWPGSARVGIAPQDLEITIFETPQGNWGIRGKPGDELALNYKVQV